MLELAVLGLLKEKPMHGYELRASLEDRLGRSFSFGTVYPTLKRLAKQGAIETEKSKGRRKTYHLTPEGEDLFDRLLDEGGAQAAEDREAFMMRLAFFGYARPETRRRLLERRRGYLLERLERMKGAFKNLKERVDEYSLELMRYGEDETTRELAWLDDRIAFEASATEERKEHRKEQRKRKRAARKARASHPPARDTESPTMTVTDAPAVEQPTKQPAVERG